MLSMYVLSLSSFVNAPVSLQKSKSGELCRWSGEFALASEYIWSSDDLLFKGLGERDGYGEKAGDVP
jgi:hypothetical protein|tara:strand:+ start:651 stop:851 length:201 start_codon:yes stop_codon:yes gene_type:complete